MAAIPTPESIKLYYFDVPFWRAEIVRIALFVGGIPFEDIRDQKASDLKEQGKLTFGAVPVLEIDGKILSQTQAMAIYAAKMAGLHPDDAWAAAKVDEAINGCTDVTTTISMTFRMPDDEKVAARKALLEPDGRLTMFLSGLEKICAENGGNGYVAGASLTVGDLAIWRLAGWLSSGTIDGIPADVISAFPAISNVCSAVEGHPKVQDWIAEHPSAYASK